MEPAFTRNSGTWPLAGMHTLPLEPDDPRLAIPHNTFPVRQMREERYVLTSNAALDKSPAEPLGIGTAAGKPPKSKRWKAAVAGSCALHAAIALCFLAGVDESAKIAGADQAGIVQLGNANEDTAAAGEIDPAVADVSIITMLDAKPVETVTAEPVTDVNAAEPVETVEPAAPVTETVEPVEEATVEPETPAQTAPVAEPETAEPAPQETAPEILATDTVQPVDDENIVAPSAQAVEPTLETTAEAAPAAPAEPVTETPAETVAEPVPEETFETLAAVAPIPEPRPEAPKAEKPVDKVEKKQASEKKEPAKPREQKSAEKRAAGSGGNAKADARRGETDGQADGKTAARSKGGNRQSAAGNAAVSNYPGKIVSKLRRALRYPAEAKRNKLRGEVRVAFTVSAGGGVGGVRIVRSSGSPVLDKAAIETVRRAAPFPAIPEGAGRSSWPFTVPLAFTR